LAIRYGQVTDLFGAVRHLRDAQTGNHEEKERAKRQAGNFPIQSTGNRFHLIAACHLHQTLERKKIKAVVCGVEHDKIYVDSAPECIEESVQTTEKCMLIHNNAWYWKDKPVPMAVDIKTGHNMYEMEKWNG